MKKTLYEILQVSNKASHEQIESAYQLQNEKLKNSGDHESQNEMKLVRLAFSTLSNHEQRAKYDQSLDLQTSKESALVYYTDESARFSTHPATKLFFMATIAIVCYMGYQHFVLGAKKIDASAQEVPKQPDNPTPQVNTIVPQNPIVPVNVVSQTAEPNQQQPAVLQQPALPNVNDIDAVPLPNRITQRKAYEGFLAMPTPRAFVICTNGSVTTFQGPGAFVGNKITALPQDCSAYAVNNDVVWGRW